MSLPRPSSWYGPLVILKRSQECLLRALDGGTWYQRETEIHESLKLQEAAEQLLRKTRE